MSCSEEDDTQVEFANWPATNDAYFDRLSDSVKNIMAANPSQTEWKRIKAWSLNDSVEGKNADYILVRVIEASQSADQTTPLYTDTAKVHYVGKYIPSPSYSTGYVFDRSFNEPFDADVSVPTEFVVSGVVSGFTTALLHMHRGDHWEVYIPYQLAYGNPSSSSSIESGSTLIFDLRLVDFRPPVLK